MNPFLDHIAATHEDCNNPALFAANSNDEEKPTPKLKELPSHLEYAFLDDNRKLPVIISSLLSDQEKNYYWSAALSWFNTAHVVVEYLVLTIQVSLIDMGGRSIPISDRAATVHRQNKVSLTDWEEGVPSSATV
ncbi:hypothetical protein Tco_1217752 [Tanacetum coccineum]